RDSGVRLRAGAPSDQRRFISTVVDDRHAPNGVSTPLYAHLVSRFSRWSLLAVFGIGVFLAGLELMITATALPSILLDLAVTDQLGKPAFSELRHASWIVNGYLLAYVVAMPLAGAQDASSSSRSSCSSPDRSPRAALRRSTNCSPAASSRGSAAGSSFRS